MSYLLGITSAATVEFFPEWNYSNFEKHNRTEHRTQGGKYYRYKWGDFRTIKFSADWLDSSDASLVNSWWDSDSELLFFVTSDTATEVFSVMIMNDNTPFAQFNKPYDNYYKGKMELETY